MTGLVCPMRWHLTKTETENIDEQHGGREALSPVLGLQVLLRVPVAIVDNAGVRCSEVDAQATCNVMNGEL